MISINVQLQVGLLKYDLETKIPLDTTKEKLEADCQNMAALIWNLLDQVKDAKLLGE